MSKTSAVTIFFTSRLGLSSLQKLLDCSKKKEKSTINCLWQCIQNPAISLHHVSSQGAGNTKHSKGLFLYLLTSHLENRNKCALAFPLARATLYKQTGISGFYACTLMAYYSQYSYFPKYIFIRPPQ